MAMTRWDPFREMMTLRQAMDRLFEDAFVQPGAAPPAAERGWFPLDLAEDGDNLVVRAPMPGVRPEDVQVTVQGNTLTIHGESKAEQEREGQHWIMRERREQTFHRSVTLPVAVNADRAEAVYEHGVLTLTLPKAEEARAKQVKIRQHQQRLEQRTSAPAGRHEATFTVQTMTSTGGMAAPGGQTMTGGAPAAVRREMQVAGSDGQSIGTVKEVRGADFLVDRSMQRDVYVPFSAVRDISGGRVTLNVASGEVDSMGWASPPIAGTQAA